MNKQDITIVVLLFLLLIGWGFFQHTIMPPARPGATAPVESSGTTQAVAAAQAPAPALLVPRPAVSDVPVPAKALPERRVSVSNELLAVTVSSWGGGIVSAELLQYDESLRPEEGRVKFDFSPSPALSLNGIPGLTTNDDFAVAAADGGREIRVVRDTGDGMRFVRTIGFSEPYRLTVTDVFTNAGSSAISVAPGAMRLGPMPATATAAGSGSAGVSTMGVDTLTDQGGARVHYWGDSDLPRLFGASSSMLSCFRKSSIGMPAAVTNRVGSSVLWAAVKNRFFVQILAPEGGAADCVLGAARDVERSDALHINSTWAETQFLPRTLAAGETLVRRSHYYIGPKKYDLLKKLGHQQDEVMQLGWLSWMCKPLLWTLNGLHRLIPNYGVAIILLTFIVRMIFWPVTHKSTVSMKRMQALQPQVQKLREKFKDSPQKMNQAMMALYRENKVNPMMGCLPMLVQIPVFFALFVVLRSAVELRYAGFLWVRDLSEPEGLLAGMIPLIGSLNILPLLMTATMVWQQALTPSTADPQQQKIMNLMSVVFLFMLYNMASGLVLYWTVSQCLSIAQLLLIRHKT